MLRGEAAGAGTDLLRLDLKGDDNAAMATFFLSGNKFTWFDHESKTKKIYHISSLSPDDDWPRFVKRIFQALVDHRFLFAGMPVQAVRERFSVRLYNEGDPHYFILEARPKKQEDLAQCTVAYAALSRKTYLPRTFIIDDPQGNRTQWDFPKFETNVKPPVTLELLSRNLPRGWQEIAYGQETKLKK
ncbi:MAG TPA: hypothetical protein VGY66_22755 [Gemmataceae bacterium]|nr:hypothetical protein [Gemmataceae bacterium]